MNALRCELRKLSTGKALIAVVLTGLFLTSVTAYGYMSEGLALEPVAPPAQITQDVVRSWFIMLLFSALVGALCITREYSAAILPRSVLLAGGRLRLFQHKLAATAVVGLGLALSTMALAAVSALVCAAGGGYDLAWTAETTKILLGVGFCVLSSAFWGLGLGLLLRNQTATILVVLVLTLVLEPAVQRLVPTVSRFLFTISLSSIYRDQKPDLLPVGWAVVVSLVWVAAAALLGLRSIRSQDIR